MRLEFWDKQTPLTEQDRITRTPQEIFDSGQFPIDEHATVLLEYLPGTNIVGAIENFGILRDIHRIDESLSDDEALEEYIRIRTAPPVQSPPENMPVTQGQVQLLGQLLTEVNLSILELGANNV